MSQSVCCHDISSLPNAQSPFSKIIALGYYDGVTSGLVLCGVCSAAYTFEMLAMDGDGTYDRQAWDRGEEMRIFSLAFLPSRFFARLVETLSCVESPRWPVWVLSRDPSKEQSLQVVDTEVKAILSVASYPSFIVATSDLLRKIVVARKVTVEQISTVQDWFAFLGLVRHADLD